MTFPWSLGVSVSPALWKRQASASASTFTTWLEFATCFHRFPFTLSSLQTYKVSLRIPISQMMELQHRLSVMPVVSTLTSNRVRLLFQVTAPGPLKLVWLLMWNCTCLHRNIAGTVSWAMTSVHMCKNQAFISCIKQMPSFQQHAIVTLL